MEGVWFEARLPLAWRNEAFPDGETLSGWMSANTVLLRALATLDQFPGERDEDLAEETAERLERLEAKVDLALNLLTQLVARDMPRPPAHPAKVSASAIEWLGKDAPEGDFVLSLYIDPRLPQALQLPAQVMSSATEQDGQRILAQFHGLDEETGEWLERTVFRRHRRAIQAAKTKTAV